MYFQEMGNAVRKARKAEGLTQQALAQSVGLSRTTINQFENGVFPDLGVKKLLAVLDTVGLDIALDHKPEKPRVRDYLRLACISANVSYKAQLTPDELLRSLLSGKVEPGRSPHLRVVFDELPEAVFEGMVHQVEAWLKPGKLLHNIQVLAKQLGSRRRMQT